LRVDDNTSAECLSTRLTQGPAEGRECVLRLDARRLGDEVPQCFNLAKIFTIAFATPFSRRCL